MKRICTLAFALIFIISTLHGQKSKELDTVKMNTKFTLKLETLDSIHYSFKMVHTEPFYQKINFSDSKPLFEESVGEGYIQGIFTYGEFGDKTNCFLLLKNGLNQPLSYDLKIKIKNKRKPVETSVVDLFPNIVSVELWSYDIEYLIFSNFEAVTQFEYFTLPEPKIDSTCIKNPLNNQQFADSLFVNYIDTLNYYFLSSSGLNIEKVVDFEKSINSVDITRDHFVQLGESLYPNKKKIKLDKTVNYKRIECPYFSLEISYYYSKKDSLVRVILFKWNVFKERDYLSVTDKDIGVKFQEKFSKIEAVMTNLLGNPTHKKIGLEPRDEIKWINKETLKAYLFKFARYGEIRLVLYKE